MNAIGKYSLKGVKEALSLINGVLQGSISLFETVVRKVMVFHEESIATARDIGMSYNQAQAYAKALASSTKELAFHYGVTSETIIKIQKGLSEATSRQLFLNKAQMESFVQMNKLAGDSSVSKFAEEMMNGMGAQIGAVENSIAKAYATSMKSGLSARKTTELIASSLGMANKLSFRNGVDGLTKMAMEAQKVGMSLQSVEGVAKTFMDFEGAIEHSAQLQMLGGAASIFGGNPLDMMYEANYDPEALQKRMVKMLGGYATFDDKTGMASVNGYNMDIIRNMGKAMGMDETEAVRVAKKNAEIIRKEQLFGNRFAGYTDEQRDLIMNRSYMKDGKLFINDAGNEAHEITNGVLPEKILEELHQYDNMSDKEIMTQQAASLKSINDMLKGLVDSIEALLGKKLVDYIPKIQQYIEKNGGKLIADVETFVTEKIPEYWQTLKGWWNSLKGWWNSLKGFWTGLKEDWEETKAILRDISRALLLGGFMAYGAKGMTALKGKFGKGAKGAKGAPSGGAPSGGAPSGGAPSGGGAPTPKGNAKGLPEGTTLGKNGRFKVNKNGDWVYNNGPKKGQVVKDAQLKSINETIKGNPNAINKPTGAASSPQSSAPTSAATAAKAQKPSMWSKMTKFTPKLVKGANIAGWAGLAGDIASDSMANSGWIEKGGGAHKTTKALSNAASYGALGATIGGFTGPAAPVAVPLLAAIGAIYGGITGWNEAAEMAAESAEEAKEKAKEAAKGKGYAAGGIVGTKDNVVGLATESAEEAKEKAKEAAKGKGYAAGGIVGTKDNVVGLATGEIVLSKTMQENLVSILKNPMIAAKPVGQNDFTYKPGNTEISKVGDSTITVKDFNINVGGTIRLDAGSSSANINMNELMRDPVFMNKMKGIIEESVSKSYYGGRKMNDLASKRGMFVQSGTIGRRS